MVSNKHPNTNVTSYAFPI